MKEISSVDDSGPQKSGGKHFGKEEVIKTNVKRK
jgi:hypothetical protein